MVYSRRLFRRRTDVRAVLPLLIRAHGVPRLADSDREVADAFPLAH